MLPPFASRMRLALLLPVRLQEKIPAGEPVTLQTNPLIRLSRLSY
jgi:hypothetical protein